MKSKIAVVTGASRGIGRCIAIDLAKRGYYVIVNYVKNEDKAEEVVSELRKYSDGVSYCADVSKYEEVEKMRDFVLENYGHIDALINNAGYIIRPGNWNIISDEDWDKSFKINAKGMYNCVKAFHPLFNKDCIGRIINIASTVGETGGAGVISYSAAKAAVINMTKAFAKEFAPNILVNSVSPGNIKTEMTLSGNPVFVQKTIDCTPLKRLGEPEEVASVVGFLCSEEASFITGQIIEVDGGYTL